VGLGDVDKLGTAYEQVRERVSDLVSDLDDEQAMVPVPACPEWKVRDVIAHMAGVCTDIKTGNLQGTTTEPWTAAQVDAREGRSLSELVGEWGEVGPEIAALLDAFPGRYGNQLIADVTTHEHDIRGALARPGARGSESLGVGLSFLIESIFGHGLVALGLGPLEVKTDAATWVVGTGAEATGDTDAWLTAVGTGEIATTAEQPVGSLIVDDFELFRAATGRRSRAQIRALDWSIDPEPYIPAFGYGPFTLRDEDLVE
jgi:uncharacterized protein (TIGR03083 family)